MYDHFFEDSTGRFFYINQPDPSEFEPEPEIEEGVVLSSTPDEKIQKSILKRAMENEFFSKVLSALKVIPDDVIYRNFFKFVCSISEKFNLRDVSLLLQSRITLSHTHSVTRALRKKQFGNIETVFKFASAHGWKGVVPSNKFSEFKAIKDNDSGFKGTIIKVCEKFLSNALSAFANLTKVNIIQSLQGTGKTELFLSLFKGERIIYCSPLKELVKQACNRFQNAGIPILNYEDLKGQLSECKESIAICINSLAKLQPENFKDSILIFDEADQVLSQLQGEMMNSNWNDVAKVMKGLVSNCKHSIFASADIPLSLHHFVTEYLEIQEYNHYQNEFIPFVGRKLISYSDKNSILVRIDNCIGNGEKIAVAGLSKTTLESLEARLKSNFPYKKIVLLTESTKHLEKQKEILKAPNTVETYDIFLYSPVIASGVDISAKFTEKVFLIADNIHTLTHFQSFQLVNRIRHFEELHFFGNSSLLKTQEFKTLTKQEIIDAHRNQLVENERHSEFFEGTIHSDKRTFTAIEIHRLLVNYEDKRSRENLKGAFISHCQERKFETESVIQNSIAENPQTFGKKLSLVLSDRRDRVLKAKDILFSDVIHIKNGKSNSEDAEYELERFKLKSIIGFKEGDKRSHRDLRYVASKSISTNLIYSQLREYFLFRADPFKLEVIESQKEGLLNESLILKGRLYRKIYTDFPIQYRRKYFEIDNVRDWILELVKLGVYIQKYLSIPFAIEKEGRKPMGFLGQVLKKFGVALEADPSNQYAFRIAYREVLFLESCFRRWNPNIANFFSKKNIIL
ncbi:plasmid replication protein, CyRepA1 family [Leptospira santarosai]|uniref:plasmid replication protein, CyRepA1 family n=1 Tax=Leptospira santarosai TaxID=28183 RepID=UPI0026E3DEB2|nr:plasmid replication protein, CyRepA1 family [Leptospira santarosai]MDO6384144.1 DEAD/DEAH box helicase family protein [Leptospira santarosai]